MTNYYVSLINKDRQASPPNQYILLNFTEESEDEHLMHYEKSGLILPCSPGIGLLEANIHWESGDETEVCDGFDRNPLTDAIDPTGYDHRAPSPGMQCITKLHTLKVRPDTPLGIRVRHNDKVWRDVTHAQFKLTILGI